MSQLLVCLDLIFLRLSRHSSVSMLSLDLSTKTTWLESENIIIDVSFSHSRCYFAQNQRLLWVKLFAPPDRSGQSPPTLFIFLQFDLAIKAILIVINTPGFDTTGTDEDVFTYL